MPQNYCHHINTAGAFCQGVPVKERDYCYWHLHENGRRMKAARTRARSERVIMQLPVLDDLHAVQVGVMQLAEAVNHGEVDHRNGRLLLAILRLAASNLKARAIWEQEAGMQDEDLEGYVEEESGFEEQYGLPKDFDLSVDPEVAFPSLVPLNPSERLNGAPVCGNDELPLNPNGALSRAPVTPDPVLRAQLGQILRDAAAPIPGMDCHVTADDMELMAVYERDGEQARLQRAAVLERNRKRREGRERRLHYEEMARNRNIQLAAEKLVRDQRKAGMACQQPADGDAAAGGRKPPQSESAPREAIAKGESVA